MPEPTESLITKITDVLNYMEVLQVSVTQISIAWPERQNMYELGEEVDDMATTLESFLGQLNAEKGEEIEEEEEKELLGLAWGLIANAYGGDWGDAPTISGWKEAAERWRDRYHATLRVDIDG